MIEKNYYVLFSDSKKSDKVSYDHYCQVRYVANSFNAVLSETVHRFGVTLFVAFSHHFIYQYLPLLSL